MGCVNCRKNYPYTFEDLSEGHVYRGDNNYVYRVKNGIIEVELSSGWCPAVIKTLKNGKFALLHNLSDKAGL